MCLRKLCLLANGTLFFLILILLSDSVSCCCFFCCLFDATICHLPFTIFHTLSIFHPIYAKMRWHASTHKKWHKRSKNGNKCNHKRCDSNTQTRLHFFFLLFLHSINMLHSCKYVSICVAEPEFAIFAPYILVFCQIGWVIWNFKGSCCHFHIRVSFRDFSRR